MQLETLNPDSCFFTEDRTTSTKFAIFKRIEKEGFTCAWRDTIVLIFNDDKDEGRYRTNNPDDKLMASGIYSHIKGVERKNIRLGNNNNLVSPREEWIINYEPSLRDYPGAEKVRLEAIELIRTQRELMTQVG